MEGPRSTQNQEYSLVLEFLDRELRPDTQWSIEAEYPTALNPQNIHNMRIITDAEKVVSHAVIKPLILKTPTAILKVAGIGSVVTDQNHRNQGLSSQIMENCIEEARRQDCDLAMLWTNLHDFYRKMGFELAGSELSTLIDRDLKTESQGLRFVKGSQVSAEAIHRLYSQHTVTSFRSIEDIRKFVKIPQTQLYTAWDAQGQLLAYAAEGKGIDLTGYIHEWGGRVPALIALLQFIRSEKKASFTLILPQHSENLVKKLQENGLHIHHGYLGMLKILNPDSLFSKIKRSARNLGVSDIVLEKRGSEFIFGFGTDLVVINDERTLSQILFGPVPEIVDFQASAQKKLAQLFPLPLWIWGWDSI